jgi:uncharacterized protein (TIGR02598 family)
MSNIKAIYRKIIDISINQLIVIIHCMCPCQAPRTFRRHSDALSFMRLHGWAMRHRSACVHRKLPSRGFSLIEVTIALGIVSFSLLAIIGLVGRGLTSVRESTNEAAIASIIQHVRAELTQPDFSAQVDSLGFNLEFNKSGGLLDNASGSSSLEDEPFYRVTFQTSTPTIPGGAASIGDSALMVTMYIASINGAATNRLSVLLSQEQGQ